MAQLRLTPRHKEMLTSLADALRQGDYGIEWILGTSSSGVSFYCFDKRCNSLVLLEGWNDAQHGDLRKFEELKLLKITRYDAHRFPDYIIFDEAEILYVVDSKFELPDPVPSSAVFNITSPNSIINVQSALHNSTQAIQNSPSLEADEKQDFETLINDLKATLAEVPAEQIEDAEAIAVYANRLAEDVSSPKPNKKAIQISAEGLQKAAATVAVVAPAVITTVQHILAFITGLQR
jgi:hypothetical protein